MPICYVLGGLGESVLSRSPNGSGIVWIDLAVIMLGKLGELRLAPNGIDPGPPDGVQVYATAALGPYLALPSLILGPQLAAQGYSVRLHWWDWRKSIYPAGVALAARIREEVAPAEPCAIIAHSAGGLVARAAWTDLGTTGDQSLVRRIVTLGTPHWGSYAIVQFWSGLAESINTSEYWNQTIGYNTAGYAPDLTGYKYFTTLDYQRLAQTWPAWYDVLPVLGAPDAASDPQREALYLASNWPAAARPQQTWLDYARDVTGPWLRSPGSQPPGHILTCLSGNGGSSPSALVDVAALGTTQALGNYLTGDGVVTQVASELEGSVVWRYGIDHTNWLPQLANAGDLVELITEVRTPGPPPPVQVSAEIQTTNVQPVPFPQGIDGGPASRACVAGACYC